jgi:eukaryotic-like serine/threonine-protein kinase
MDTTHIDPASPVPKVPIDPLHEPRSLGGYRVLRRLGEGGMGAVYLCYHEREGQQVAIKVLPDALASNPGFVTRFYREARSGAMLNHPNIVRGIGVDQDPATHKHYLVLEFVDGASAHSLLDRFGKLSVGDAVHIALDVARALEHAHSRNIIHRDIKPDNILVAKSGVTKLADFGLAKRTDEASHLTAARQGFGTSYYMPYEQALNAKQADGRSDIYALGATLYHLLTGEVPFAGDNHLEVVEKKRAGDYIPASALNVDVPLALDPILDKMMARDPDVRYQTASELIIDLERTRLEAKLPSFADPDLALQDPWVRARMVATAQPTRPDQEVPLEPEKSNGAIKADQWQVRYRNREGKWCQVKATTKQLTDRIRTGRVPPNVKVRRAEETEFQAVYQYPEFLAIKPEKTNGRRAKRSSKAIPPTDPPAPQASKPRFPRWLLAAGVATVVLVGTAAVVVIYLISGGA